MSMNTRPSVAYPAIEIGRFGALQIGEETSDPGRQMLFENLLIGCRAAPAGGR